MTSSKHGSIATLSFNALSADEVLHAAASTGFFYLTDVPIDAQVIEQTWKASETLFLTQGHDADEQRLASRDRQGHTGYTLMHEEKLDLSNSGTDSVRTGDYKESFYLAQLDTLPPRQTLPPLLHSHRASLTRLFNACTHVCAHILRKMADALELDDSEYFVAQHHAFDDRLRLIHYPPTDVGQQEDAIRAGAHTDYGSVTLLFQRDVSGLQVLLDGAWVDVAPPNDSTTVVVNVADALEFWSAGVLRSAQHRVIMPRTASEAHSRFSIAYFCQPDAEAILAPVRCTDSVARRTNGLRRSADEYEKELRRKGIESVDEHLTGGQHLQSRLSASYA